MYSHFIPRLLLRHFASDKGRISLYDLKKNALKLDVKIDKAFAIDEYYPDEVEREFNKRIEGAFGNLLNNVILKPDQQQIILNRRQVTMIKKFLSLLMIRSIHDDDWIKNEMNFEETAKKLGIDNNLLCPFEEKKIEGETAGEYWLRTLRCILDTENGLPEEIEKEPNRTAMAWRWASTMKFGYLGFWSSRKTNADFLVTDIGMTSESETADERGMPINPKKLNALLRCAQLVPDDPLLEKYKNQFLQIAMRQVHFHENFMEFPLSKDLMIVLINPYYKIYLCDKDAGFPFPALNELTRLKDERAFAPNENKYAHEGQYGCDDVFIYDIHELDEASCIYLNMLTLDRIDTTLGFADPAKIVKSLQSYQSLPKTCRLNDYSKLIEQIQRRSNYV